MDHYDAMDLTDWRKTSFLHRAEGQRGVGDRLPGRPAGRNEAEERAARGRAGLSCGVTAAFGWATGEPFTKRLAALESQRKTRPERPREIVPPLLDKDAWRAVYRKGSARKRYDLLRAIVGQPLPEGFDGEREMLHLIVDDEAYFLRPG